MKFLLASLLASVSAVYLEQRASDFVSATAAAGLVPNANASATFPRASEANFCLDTLDTDLYYWCNNAPKAGGIQKLEFSFDIPTAGNYYVGVKYSAIGAGPFSLIPSDSLGVGKWQSIPVVGQIDYIQQVYAASTVAAAMNAGPQTVRLGMMQGSVKVHTVVVTDTLVNGQIVPPSTYPEGAIVIPMTDFTSGVSVKKVNSDIDPVFPGSGATQPNFCANAVNATQLVWCFNAVTLGKQSSLTFGSVSLVPGTQYYFGMKVANTDAGSSVAVLLNGINWFGTVALPITSTNQRYTLAAAELPYTVTNSNNQITISVTSVSMVRVMEMVISPTPLTLEVLPTTPVAPSTTAQATVSTGATTTVTIPVTTTKAAVTAATTKVAVAQVNVNNNNSASAPVLSDGAIAGIVIGAVAFLLGVTVGTIFAVRKSKSSEKKAEKKTGADTPQIKKMTEQ